MEEMRVTVVIAAEGVEGNPAIFLSAFFNIGAAARAEPQTKTKDICIANPKRLQTPLPQFSTTSIGV